MVGVMVPHSDIVAVSNTTFIVSIFVGIVGLILLSIVIIFISRNITKPLSDVNEELLLLAEGQIKRAKKLAIDTGDEIAEIAESTNTLIDAMNNTATFAAEIGRGNLDVDYAALSDDDLTGQALLEMRESLNRAKMEEEKRRTEEERQQWATSGFAKFGDILRNNTEDMESFAYGIISELVKYTDSNQGALYLINEDDSNDPFIEMKSCYAYNRKKYVDKRIEIGENLVGQCILEGESIYMTDIPQNYIHITSGLGDANPNSLILVPLCFNEKTYGVIEMASFRDYETYKRDFIQKVSENIASTVSTVKINLKTVSLLEESKLKSEELAAQEEEMRQNMEELQTTQEESARREMEMNGIVSALNSSYMVGELDLDANFISVNDKAQRTFGLTQESALGQNIRSFMHEDELDAFEEIWQDVLNGKSVKKEKKIKRAVGEVIISESYSPIYDEHDEIYKVLNIGVELEEL
jgi:PAS domain S-box-containing protein